MKRRPKGTGTIEAMPDGRFRPRLPIGHRRRLDPCSTREEAERMLNAALAELAEGALVASGGQSVRAFGESVIDERERTGTADTKSERSRWATHVATWECAEWPLKAVTSADAREWLSGMLEKKARPGKGHKRTRPRRLSRSVAQNTLNLLRVVFRIAVEKGLIAANPFEDVRLPRGEGATHDPWTYLLPDEQRALITCDAIPEDDRMLIAFAIGTGLRQGELWNLELRDVHPEEGRIVVRYGKKGGSTKGRRIRRVPLFGLARAALDAWLPLVAKRPNPHGLLFPLPSGARRQKGAPEWWASALAAAGIIPQDRHDGRQVRWHDLRHTCGSSLVAGWWGRRWSLIEVRDLLGHRSVTTTERYSHLAEGVLDAAARETDTSRIRPASSAAPAPKSTELLGSHLRDLNSRPTVYEAFGVSNDSASIPPEVALAVDLSRRAGEALDAIARGGPDGWRVAIALLGEIYQAGRELEADAGCVPRTAKAGR